jgi:hypothetical protein
MQTKYNALEGRSKELLVSQGSAVSGASVALACLGNRLELLVEQLITSYNISEQDLEVRYEHEIPENMCAPAAQLTLQCLPVKTENAGE